VGSAFEGSIAGSIIAVASYLTQGNDHFQIRYLARFLLNARGAGSYNVRVNEDLTANRSYPLAVIMERITLSNRWASEQWEAKGVVRDLNDGSAGPRVIVEREGLIQVLFPGFRVKLTKDEAEGYYLNLTSPEPKVFVLWRAQDDVARPERISVSYGEGTRWADSGEQVDGVALPAELVPWMADFVEANYRPEPPKKKRYASSRDKGRMGGV
jgi:hypothetical protein